MDDGRKLKLQKCLSWNQTQSEVSDIKLNLPLRLRTCATRCGRSLWGSQHWRNKASGRVCRKSWSTGPPLWSSSEEGEKEPSTHRYALTYLLRYTNPLLRSIIIPTYSTQVPRARRGVQTKKKPCNRDHIVFNKWLSKHREWPQWKSFHLW